ncbi:dual specificity protein kinase YAK1 homolog isoform X1 [Selaginella moellendorffii]|nr:dual specificity protein kinase YAK1 homolog isoform X1 [Selaginella moellendorffii]|eukprot:XP_024516982.1 dual specificity protein kinase YAK1 homolog isoform X1 [Selaginella moellendorffii]
MVGEKNPGAWMSSEGPDGIPGAGIKPSSWRPRVLGFQPYNSMRSSPETSFRAIAPPRICVRLTKFIVETYRSCNPSFTYSDTFNPKRYLTNPSAGVSNNGLDNKNSDLILAVNGIIYNPKHRYVVKEMLGQGTFGQVVKCWSDRENGYVAVKVIKNQPAYYQQALVEIEILKMLNRDFDPDNQHHIVRILDWFLFEQHLCIAFELLSHNLYELIKVNRHRGISLHLLRIFTKQILDSLGVLRNAGVIHCDLKPENILLSTSLKSGEIKLIDFGSACLEHRTVYKYIQSRYYRSPEVVLGHPYTTAIDMWSLGCVAAELFLGLPLFSGESEYDLLRRMIDTLGCQPPDQLLRDSANTSKYFKTVSAAPPSSGGMAVYQFLTVSEVKAREAKEPLVGKSYFRHTKLEDIISKYPYKSSLSAEEQEAERQRRLSFLDFLRGLVRFDPKSRWTPHQAAQHPFVTEQPFTGPFEPLPETPRTPVGHPMTVEHNPGAGHWFGAGLSPQVSHIPVPLPQYSSPQYYGGQFSFASSYGSCGSYGSCDGYGMGGSYAGSYTEASNMYCNYPTPPQIGYEQWRRLHPPIPAGYGQLGRSPSSSVFTPMSLGGSPSQFTPPSSQFPSPGSSPGRCGPPSPARYGKAASVSHYKQRRGLYAPMNQSPGYDGSWQHMPANGSFEAGSHLEAGPSGSYSRPYGQSHLRPAMKSSSYKAGSLASYLSTSETIVEAAESHQDAGDWFPNDSIDLLEDDSGHRQLPAGGTNRLMPGHGVPGPYHGKASRLSEPLHSSQAAGGKSMLHGSFDETHHASSSHRVPFPSPPSRLNQPLSSQHQRKQQQQPPQASPDLRAIYQPGYPHSYTGFIAGSYPRPPVSNEQVERQLAGVVL